MEQAIQNVVKTTQMINENTENVLEEAYDTRLTLMENTLLNIQDEIFAAPDFIVSSEIQSEVGTIQHPYYGYDITNDEASASSDYGIVPSGLSRPEVKAISLKFDITNKGNSDSYGSFRDTNGDIFDSMMITYEGTTNFTTQDDVNIVKGNPVALPFNIVSVNVDDTLLTTFTQQSSGYHYRPPLQKEKTASIVLQTDFIKTYPNGPELLSNFLIDSARNNFNLYANYRSDVLNSGGLKPAEKPEKFFDNFKNFSLPDIGEIPSTAANVKVTKVTVERDGTSSIVSIYIENTSDAKSFGYGTANVNAAPQFVTDRGTGYYERINVRTSSARSTDIGKVIDVFPVKVENDVVVDDKSFNVFMGKSISDNDRPASGIYDIVYDYWDGDDKKLIKTLDDKITTLDSNGQSTMVTTADSICKCTWTNGERTFDDNGNINNAVDCTRYHRTRYTSIGARGSWYYYGVTFIVYTGNQAPFGPNAPEVPKTPSQNPNDYWGVPSYDGLPGNSAVIAKFQFWNVDTMSDTLFQFGEVEQLVDISVAGVGYVEPGSTFENASIDQSNVTRPDLEALYPNEYVAPRDPYTYSS